VDTASAEAARAASGLAAKRFIRRVSDPAGTLGTAWAALRARVTFRGCAAVGSSARLFGRCRVSGRSGIRVGRSLLMLGGTAPCELTTHDGGRLEIGDRVFVNYGASISAHRLVQIGNDCKIGQHAIILDCDYHDIDHPLHDGGHGQARSVLLEEGVWLGARVIVLKGVTIGKGSVIAAGSVVTRNVPAGVLAAGVPARVVRRLPFASSGTWQSAVSS